MANLRHRAMGRGLTVTGWIKAWRAATMLLLVGACFAVTASPASAAASWNATPSVSCDTITIDPTSWIKVTFTGTVNGAPFSQSAPYGGDGSHNAHVSISNLTSGNGNVHIVVTASSNFGFGPVTSETADVTLNCDEIVTQGSTIAAPHDHGDGTQTTVAGVTKTAAHGSSGRLPFTGSDAGRLAIIGCGALAVGLVASRARTRRRARRLSRGVSAYD